MTETLLVAVPALPALAALAISLARPVGERAASWAVRSTVIAFAAGVVVAGVVGIDGPIDVVAEGSDGGALVGLHATRVTALLGLLATAVGLVVQSFSGRALRGDPRESRFFMLTSLLTAATTAVAFAATLALLCAAWIVTGVALAALVGHRAAWPPAQRAARRTRHSLWAGDAALLVATVVTVACIGDLDLRSPAAAAEELSRASIGTIDGGVLSMVAVLLAFAGISRSALVPLHRWLPSTVAAPTPVSALLHAGVVNGAGVLLIKLAPVFGASAVATHLAFAAGAATALYATSVMLVRSDVKGSLAWSTAGQMGFMTVQLAVGAFAAALLHLLGHGMYKAALFLGSGGAVTAHLRHRQRPAPHRVAPTVRLATALLVPPAALRAAFVLIDPHLPAPAEVLVVLFAWVTAAGAIDGWLRSAPSRPVAAVVTASISAAVGVVAYVGGLTALERFVAPALLAEVSEPVTSTVLAVAVAAVGVAVAAVWFTPGDTMRRLRDRVYALVLTSAIPGADRDPQAASTQEARPGWRPRQHRHGPAPAPVELDAAIGMTDPDEDHHRRSTVHTDLLVDVSRAADIVAPLWPLTSFVAVNPLGGLQHLPFDDATAVARRWLGARTHPTLAAFRAAYARGAITDADLRRAIVEVDGKLASPLTFEVGGRAVHPAEIVRLDLLIGPGDDAETAAPVGGADAGALRAVDALVAAWCAAYVDEAGVPWAMPGRERGFFRAWRDLARHDRRLRRLAGRSGLQWLAQLPDHASAALAASLDALGVGDADRVDALRGLLSRLPGWAGYARWHDEWAPADHDGPALRLIELLSVHAAATAAVAAGRGLLQPPHREETQPVDELIERRAAAVLDALGSGTDDPFITSAVRGVLEQVPPPVRSSMWLEAQEGNFRDRLLGLLSRLDPGEAAEQPEVQAVFCIDVRSEGLRRQLEACGPYETLGFAGFFGVPVRWRPLGSTMSQPRCPVLVTPRHEVAEQPLDADGAARFLAGQGAVRAGHSAFHGVKGSLGGPFVLAEAAGYVLGPVAAARTLAPGLAQRVAQWSRGRALSVRTRPAVEAEHHDSSGLALEERVLFAEAIVRTMGLARFGRLIVLCGHGSYNVNNPHASSYDCGACGGAPGGASARVAATILNDPAVRAGLEERGITVPDDTYFAAAEHDTASDEVTVLDRSAVPDSHEALIAAFERDVAVAGERLARERSRRLPGDPARVRVRGHDWAQVRPEWGLAGNAAFVVGPRSITADLDLACRVFLHSYDAGADPDGTALETILTAPLVVAQWISAQYYFSAVDPDAFGAGDKTLHNPVGGIGVVLGEGGDLQVGLPAQALAVGERQIHEPLRLLAIVQAPLTRIEEIIQRNQVLQELIGGKWITVAGRSHGDEHWSIRSPAGTWMNWIPADASVDHTHASLEVR